MNKDKNLIILKGRSGAGKTSLANALDANLLTYTTREKRAGEINGIDYIFVDKLPEDIASKYIVNETWQYGVSLDYIGEFSVFSVISEDYAIATENAAKSEGINVINIQLDISREEQIRRLKDRGETELETRFEIEEKEGAYTTNAHIILVDGKTVEELKKEVLHVVLG